MTDYLIPYGKRTISITIPQNIKVDVIQPHIIKGANDPSAEVWRALKHPVNDWDISRYKDAKSVSIAINDKTRPVHNYILIPPLLEILESFGISKDRIKFVIASGTHTPMKVGEFHEVLPDEILHSYDVICHDARDQENLVFLGTTQKGTPVWINKSYYEADLRIAVGNMEPHHFMGFSGGVKASVIGLAGMQTINANHNLMKHPNAQLGNYSDNPVRMDVEEIGKIIGIHYCINEIMNSEREIVHVLAGNPIDVMLKGIPLVRDVFEAPVKELYDLVIASPGGYPRDINIIQSEKGLSHAAMITKDGGHIIMIAECSEGSGNIAYEKWMDDVRSYDQILKRFEKEELTVGPHKAYQIAQYARRVDIRFKTDLETRIMDKLLLKKVSNLKTYFKNMFQTLGSDARVAFMPKANTTIPKIDHYK